MLNEKILSGGQAPGAFQAAEADEGLKQALAKASGSLPTPKIGIFSLEGSVYGLKGRDLRAKPRSDGKEAKGGALSHSQNSHPAEAIGPRPRHHGGQGLPV